MNLRALDVSAGQFVELRALVPRRFFTSTDGTRVESGPGLDAIVAEERADAAAYERDRRRIDEAKENLGSTLAKLLALALLPALAIIGLVGWRYGRRERDTPYDRGYEQEPPTQTHAALVPTLLRQGDGPGSLEFTATIFELIRRGRYLAEPVTTERKIWGGLKTQQVADLELSLGDLEAPVEAFEEPVARVVDPIRCFWTRRRCWARSAPSRSSAGSAGSTPSRRAGRASSRSRSAAADRRRGHDRRLGVQPPPLAPSLAGRAGRGRALGGVPSLPARFPAPRRRAARDARALGALPGSAPTATSLPARRG